MKRKLLFLVPSAMLVLTVFAGPASAHDFVDYDCDGYDDNTGQWWSEHPGYRANGVCGGVFG